jgi:hypothetical protein
MKKLGVCSSLVSLVFLALSLMTGCGSSSHPPVSISVSPGSASVQAGGTAQFTATVTNDSANKGVTWTVTCSTSSCGSASPSSTPSGTATTYTAPSNPPSSNVTVTITATSVADTTKTASATVTLAAVGISVAPTSATVPAGSTKQFTATVNNSSNASVTWTLTSGGSACSPGCGSLSSSTSNPVTYTAPATAPSSNLAVTITATSAADSTKTASATITVPAITVSVSPSSATVDFSQTMNFTATVSNDPASAGVTWALTQSGAACLPANCGSLSNNTATSVTYTAPSTAPSSDVAVVLTATSVTDTSKSATANITVPAITVSISPSTPSVAINGTQNFTATVSNDPNNAGVTSTSWILTQSGSASSCSPGCGSLSNQTSTSVTYTAPATVPTSPTVTLTATSATDPTKSGPATITITATVAAACGSGSESLLNGQYAFLLKGFDNSSPANPVLIGGVVTVNGSGGVTAGTMDMNLAAGVQTGLNVSSGSYQVGSDHRGCMTLTTSAGTQDYRFSLGGISGTPAVASTGNMIDFDTAGPFTAGILLKQTPSAFTTAINGNFAFGVSSPLYPATSFNGVSGGKFAAVGVLNFLGGVLSGGELDVNENGQLDFNSSNTNWPSSPTSIGSGGTFTVGAGNGRGTLVFTPTGANPVHGEVYVISTSEFLAMSTDAQATNAIWAGTALQQSGSFSNSSLNGTSVLYTSSLSSTAAGDANVTIGLITTTGSGGALTFSGYHDDGGSFSTQSGSGTFSVDSTTGRVLLSGAGVGNHPPLFYVVTANEAFFLDSSGSVQSGFFEPQTGSSFTAGSVSGTYPFGTIDPESPGVSDDAGVATFDGVSAISGTSDSNSPGSQDANQTISDTYSVDSNGLVHDPSSCTVSATSTTCTGLLLIISPTKLVRMDTKSTTTSPAIHVAQQ